MINQPLFYETMDALLLSSFSCQVVSDSATLWTTVMARPPCPLLSPRVCPKSCPLNQWCHPTISSSVIPFPSCLQSFPASGSFQMSQFFASGGQSIGVSASTTVLPMNVQDSFPLRLTGLISLQSKGLSTVFFNTTVWKHQFFGTQPSLWSNSHICTTTRKALALTLWTLSAKWCHWFYNAPSKFVIAFLPRSRHLLISWWQSPSTVILEPKKRKSVQTLNVPWSPSWREIWVPFAGGSPLNMGKWYWSKIQNTLV